MWGSLARAMSAPRSTKCPLEASLPLWTSTTRPSTTSRITVMRFSVIVPVLSEQITVVEPSVSTAGSRRTRAPLRARRQRPAASATVVTAGSPSGMAATARLMAVSSISPIGCPCRMPASPTTPHTASASPMRRRPSASTWRSSGVARVPASATS